MSAPLQPHNLAPRITISFTELLYGVVIGAALQRVELSLSLKNILLILALIIVVQAFLFYHQDILDLDPNPSKYRLTFVLDMLVLGSWYPLSLAPDIVIFLCCLSIF